MLRAALVVFLLLRMLAAIQLNDQHGLVAGKINDVVVDLMLPAELVATQLPVAQPIPEFLFRIRHVLAQSARSVYVLAFHP
jgi:hypothetical protein